MESIWRFVLTYPAMLVVPACGFVLSLLMVRIKKRYVNEGVLFRRASATERDDRPSEAANTKISPPFETDAMALAHKRMEEMFQKLGSGVPTEVQRELSIGVDSIITEIQNLYLSREPDVDDFITTAEAAKLLFVSRRHVVKLLEQGKLRLHHKTGNNRYVTKASVLKYQANQHAAEKAYQASKGEEE